jgi:hypothetical protein
MELTITIEVDDRAPKEEYCGENCKFFVKGYCNLFDERLEDDSYNKMDVSDDNKINLEKTKEIRGWRRNKKCVEHFYVFGKARVTDNTKST